MGNVRVFDTVVSPIDVTTPTGAARTFTNGTAFVSSPIAYFWPNPSATQEVHKQFQVTVPSGYASNLYRSGKVTAPGCTCSDLVIGSWTSSTQFTAYTKVSWQSITQWPSTLNFTITIEFNTGMPKPEDA